MHTRLTLGLAYRSSSDFLCVTMFTVRALHSAWSGHSFDPLQTAVMVPLHLSAVVPPW